MAKSRKPRKATDPKSEAVDKLEDAEKIVSDVETDLPRTAEEIDAKLHEEAAQAEASGEALTEQMDEAELAETTSEEDLEDLRKLDGEDIDAVAQAEADSEREPYGEAEADADAESKAADAEELQDVDAKSADTREGSTEAETSEDANTDSAPEPEPEPEEAKPAPPSPPPAAQSGGSVWPAVFGGVIAAMIGFLVGRGDVIDDYLPAAFQRPSADTTAIDALTATSEELSAQAAEIAAQAEAQAARIAALEEVSPTEILESVAGLETDLEEVAQRLAALEERPVAVEPQGDTVPPEAVAELQAALEAQKAEIAALAERAAAAEERAAGEAAQILARAALTRVVTAVDSGESFAPALTDLEEVTPVEVPSALRESAEAGVPTIAELQDSFPEAARAGLAAARSEVPESEAAGLTGFLKRQLNVRSVTPREGDDPDAVLSRAQAAVRAGDLGAALSEMEALPDAARTAMNDWLEAASARTAAQDAANELADSLNSN